MCLTIKLDCFEIPHFLCYIRNIEVTVAKRIYITLLTHEVCRSCDAIWSCFDFAICKNLL